MIDIPRVELRKLRHHHVFRVEPRPQRRGGGLRQFLKTGRNGVFGVDIMFDDDMAGCAFLLCDQIALIRGLIRRERRTRHGGTDQNDAGKTR